MSDTTILNEIGEALESRGFVHCCNAKSLGQILDSASQIHKTLKEISLHLYNQQDMARCRALAEEELSKSLFE